MYKGKKILAIIPARSGSKGIAHKNIRPFAGKPLLAWSILAAIRAEAPDEVYVSTDSARYAEIAEEYGASVPFLRPAELSGDSSPASGYIIHALEEYRARLGKLFDYFVLLQPTNPLRTPEQIDEGVRMAVDGDLPSVVSVSVFDTDLRLVHRFPDGDFSLSSIESPNDIIKQDAGRLYKINGLLYVGKRDDFIKTGSFYAGSGKAMVTNSLSSVDIDNEIDFLFAEFLAERSGRF